MEIDKQSSTKTHKPSSSLDGSLTNLGWLQALGCTTGLDSPLVSCPDSTSLKKAKKVKKEECQDDEDSDIKSVNNKQPAPGKKKKKGLKEKTAKQALMLKGNKEGEDVEPKISKPPQCYATLIYMAMNESNRGKLTLGEIYDYVQDNFLYYRVNDNGWKNSIRHNLTQHKCFERVSRANDRPGKGGFWRMAKGYEVYFHNGIFKRKRRKTPGYDPKDNSAFTHIPGSPAQKRKEEKQRKNLKKVYKKKNSAKSKKSKKSKTRSPASYPTHQQHQSSVDFGLDDDLDDGLDGIDWDSFTPDDKYYTESAIGGLSETSVSDNAALLEDLSIMDDTPDNILADINQNNQRRNETVTDQLHNVESNLNLDSSINSNGSWNGEDLMVVGVGLQLLEGTSEFQQLDTKRTPEDIDMVDIPCDWIG
eukprot:m.230934 g.230934  ORF g.230934 m.230934 type:complete len:419 (+) comp16003_c0_seq3:987-2243(+)